MYKTKSISVAKNNDPKGSKNAPYSESEAYYLIDKGKFKGGFVIDGNGLVNYWLGEAEVIAYNSASEEDLIYDFNSDFYVEFCNSYYNSDYYPYSTSDSSNSWPYVDETISTMVDATDTAGDALERNPYKINYGSNGKFYFETKTGRVFCGNQYVGTTSINGVGVLITKYVGAVNIGLTAYNVIATYNNDGLEAATKEATTSIGGFAGAIAGGKIGTIIGSWGGPIGAIAGGIIGSITGGIGGEIVGSYLIEIAIE